MSKSIGNVLRAEDFIAEYGVEALRYYFAREIVPTDDGDLTAPHFKEVYNANLANGLGNLVSRTLKMTEQYFGGRIAGGTVENPPFHGNIAPVTGFDVTGGVNVPYVVINDILPRYHAHMRAHEVNKAADVVWELIGKLDQYITDYEPFKLVKTNSKTTELVLWGVVYGLSHITEMIAPLMPQTADTLRRLIKQEVSEDVGENIIFITEPLTQPLFMRKA
ncbi:MAG: Methionine-tRNA ligase [Parcubacteria group bacterium GW2011_GWA1_47_8]|nr:MAG: Methionine-tRNA ligase [Parcubacteria group bacterium GW2011_GWA1_47_8]